MKLSVMFPSKYLKAEDLDGADFTLKIKAITRDEVTMSGGRKDSLIVGRFHKAKKNMILNKGNCIAIDHVVDGKGDSENWIDKDVTLTPVQTKNKGEWVSCLRVRRPVDGKVYFITLGGWLECKPGGKPKTKTEED